MNYKSTSSQDGFGIALTNLLLYMNDRETANRVLSNYEFHPLVRPKGDVCAAFVTRLVKDLTEEKYTAVLYMDWDADPKKNIDSLDALRWMNTDALVKIIAEEEKQKNLRGFSKRLIHSKIPSILFWRIAEKCLHAVTYLGDGGYIEGGAIKNSSQMAELGFKEPDALVEIIKR